MPEDSDRRCTGFEVGNGDYIVCDPDAPHAWIRSDTAVALTDANERRADRSTRRR